MGQRREANTVNADANANAVTDIDISISQRLHRDVTATMAGAMPSRWRWVGATRAGEGRHNDSGRGKEGVAVTVVAAGGKRAKSGQLEVDGMTRAVGMRTGLQQ